MLAIIMPKQHTNLYNKYYNNLKSVYDAKPVFVK